MKPDFLPRVRACQQCSGSWAPGGLVFLCPRHSKELERESRVSPTLLMALLFGVLFLFVFLSLL